MASLTGSRSILGPLTTAFRRPSSCTYLYSKNSDEAYQAQRCTGITTGYYGITSPTALASTGSFRTFAEVTVSMQPLTEVVSVDDIGCWPSATATPLNEYFEQSQPSPLNGWGFYSPGLVCPNGYTTACTAVASNNGSQFALHSGVSFAFQFQPLAGETAAGCCPTGYECYGATGVQPYQTCISTVLAGQLSTIACDSNSAVPTSTSTFNVPQTLVATETSWWTIPYTSRGSYFTTTSPTDTTTSTLTLPYFSVFAPMIQMNWKAEDRPTVPTTLSTGSKAAIGVVVPLSILMVATMFAFLVFRRQKQRRNRPAEFHKPELDANEKHNAHLVALTELPATERRIEMSPDERHELSISEQLNEIGSEARHELPVPNTIHESDGP